MPFIFTFLSLFPILLLSLFFLFFFLLLLLFFFLFLFFLFAFFLSFPLLSIFFIFLWGDWIAQCAKLGVPNFYNFLPVSYLICREF